MRTEVIRIANEVGVVPLFSSGDHETNCRAVDACAEAAERLGIATILFEFTCRPAGWPKLLRSLADHIATKWPNRVILGSGSCIMPVAVNTMHDNGARFVVSPLTSPDMITNCILKGIACMPAAQNTQGLYAAWLALGKEGGIVKLFPSDGGPKLAKATLDPLGDGDYFGDGSASPLFQIMPTGLAAADLENLQPWFSVRSKAGGVVAVGGSSALFAADEVKSGNWPAISARAEKLFRHAREVKASLKK